MPSLFKRTSLSNAITHAAAALLLLPAVGHANDASDALLAMQNNTWATRTTSLRDLGFKTSIVMDATQPRQEFYMPVPRGMALDQAAVHFDSNYLKAENGSATLLLSVDGQPVSATKIEDEKGDANRTLVVPPTAHDSGFVRLGVNWGSAGPIRRCDASSALGNALIIDPTTRMTYRYDSAALSSIDDAWAALPGTPTIMISSVEPGQPSFDAAWRLGVALARVGKQAMVRTFPQIGETVDAQGLDISPALAGYRSFAALKQGGQHKLATQAEIGAWIVASAPGALGDIVVSDKALAIRITEALDALAQEVAGSPDMVSALAAWRERRATLAGAHTEGRKIELATLGRATLISVTPEAGGAAASMLDEFWRSQLTTRLATLDAVLVPAATGEGVRQIRVGGAANHFDVTARGDWNTSMPLSAMAADGRIPQEIVFDVAMAPGASSTRPVVSMFWNDTLLAAKQMNADGAPERLEARVPGYVIGVDNVLRVSFQRQPVSAECNEVPQGFPANVLPSSYLKASHSEPDGTFGGVLPLLAGAPQLFIPASFLKDAPNSLLRTIRLASASGLSAARTELKVVQEGQSATPDRPFLSLDTVVVNGNQHISGNRPSMAYMAGHETRWTDQAGVIHISTAEVIRSGEQYGVLWHAVSGSSPRPAMNAVIVQDGSVVDVTTAMAWIKGIGGGQGEQDADAPWRRYLSWGMPIVLIAALGFLALVIAASVASRKRKNGK